MQEEKDTAGEKRKINIPEAKKLIKPLTLKDLDNDLKDRVNTVTQEFIDGLHFIREHRKTVTIFGSARLPEESVYYQKARTLGEKIVNVGYDVITGGGPGIMEGANRGAGEGEGGGSLGFNIELPEEQILNPYVEDHIEFYYFFSRKVMLTFSAEAYVFFPGGYGTLDEFFEILTLVQTNKIVKVPIILVGKEFWRHIDKTIYDVLYFEFETIDENDMELYHITDDENEIIEIIKNAPLREE